MINAKKFSKSRNLYIDEFKKVLSLMIDCYYRIRENEILLPNQFETFLRNVLVKKYLRIYKNSFSIGYLSFEAEPGEIDNNYKSIGFIDIKVSNIGHKDLLNEEEYYSFECKRLDGSSKLNKEYIEEGIFRYVDGKYSSRMSIAGMIGFVQNGTIEFIVQDINGKIKANSKMNCVSLVMKHSLVEKFDNSYYSSHNRNNGLVPIDIYHLMFDYIEI